jgi:hypothetical protein
MLLPQLQHLAPNLAAAVGLQCWLLQQQLTA